MLGAGKKSLVAADILRRNLPGIEISYAIETRDMHKLGNKLFEREN